MSGTKRTYGVTLPIAGHAFVEVEAESEEAAIEAALNTVTSKHLESWEALEQFNEGNVCYCPSPWEAEAVEHDEQPDAQREKGGS